MKKFKIMLIGLLSVSSIYAQDISDALRYSQSEIQGTARFRALSGAFGALGGDMSAININPASSAVFNRSQAAFSGSINNRDNKTIYFDGTTQTSDTNFNISQGGATFVFASNSDSPWKKITLGIAYDRTNGYSDNWNASGNNINTKIDFIDDNKNVLSPGNSIAGYFFEYANNPENLINLADITLLTGETIPEAYQDIGNAFGNSYQQAFLGYQSFILDPVDNIDNNTQYDANIASGNFDHNHFSSSTGYNGKVAFNFAAQYEDNLYLGLNLNSHFLDYQSTTILREKNTNPGSLINFVEFENSISTLGRGFSFQLGGIAKITPEFRVGLTYDSPTWYSIDDETTQRLQTRSNDGILITYEDGFEETINGITIAPQTVNIYETYRLQTPSKINASLAYVFGTKGLLSFDYSRKNYSNIELRPEADFSRANTDIANTLTNASTYRLGGEYKHKALSFRGGYRFEESPYKDGVTIGDLNGYSFGLGYNFSKVKFDLTYDQWNRTNNTPLYNVGLIDTANIDTNNYNVTFTVSFNI